MLNKYYMNEWMNEQMDERMNEWISFIVIKYKIE